MNSLGWVLSAYAANVHYLFITFGVTAGKHIDFLTLILNIFVGHLDNE